MIELLVLVCGVVIGAVSMSIFQTQRRINAYDRKREWADREWDNRPDWSNASKRLQWWDRYFAYQEGWRDGMDCKVSGPSDWRGK